MVGAYAVLALFALVAIAPFYWMFVTGSNTTQAATTIPPTFLPGSRFQENVATVLERLPFARAMLNSFVVSVSVAASVVLLSTLAGFAFAKYRFRGRRALFLFIVGTMLLPTELTIVPRYVLMGELGWIDSLQAVIVPGLVSAYGTFWMKQAIEQGVRDDLLDAAQIDGCGFLRSFWHIVLPSIRPALAALGLLSFVFTWNDFLWPAVVLQSADNQTIQVAMQSLMSVHATDFAVVLAATSLAVAPLLLIYVLFARQFIAGITDGASTG
jgi:cellobiose transport system permease protein